MTPRRRFGKYKPSFGVSGDFLEFLEESERRQERWGHEQEDAQRAELAAKRREKQHLRDDEWRTAGILKRYWMIATFRWPS